MALFSRRETQAHDDRRTYALLDALDGATEAADSELTEFDQVVLHGVARDPRQSYPPPGHTYPKRG
ncbi:hypothetical protein [Streptomyces niveus]|uniref:hypothetical protein n=1 Tax=Streptomyces niveus TaxID=193462 RepID=UPI0007C800BA|nr:hypothetical protein [Streptomyces niveus]